MRHKISVIGSGYVGLATGIGFASLGYKVIFVDIDKEKVRLINSGRSPIYEKNIENYMKKYKNNYYATTDYKSAILDSDISFICVGTPSKPDGGISLKFIKEASRSMGIALKEKERWHLVVVKSTVLPGTTENIVKSIIEKYSRKKAFSNFGLAMNPEFLREGSALHDFLNPDRIVIGVNDEQSKRTLLELYKPINAPKVIVDIKTAEMIKYVSNAFLATKVSFSNEIGNICKRLGIDARKVFEIVGMDHRISPYFFNCGLGWGGSCFPKDLAALIKFAKDIGEDPKILKAVVEVNEEQPKRMIALLKKHIPDLKGRVIGLLGLAFKPNTDDIRESRAIILVRELLKEGAKIVAYDPKATDNFKRLFPNIEYAQSANEVLEKTNIILIATEWEEFERLDYSGKVVIDGRRIKAAEKTAKIYEGMCW